jgi:hypothetical protein
MVLVASGRLTRTGVRRSGDDYPPQSHTEWEQRFSDWSIWRVAAPAVQLTAPRWQYWRGFWDVWLPAPFLDQRGFRVECTPGCVSIQVAGKELGRWSDWTYKLEEKCEFISLHWPDVVRAAFSN